MHIFILSSVDKNTKKLVESTVSDEKYLYHIINKTLSRIL